LVIFNRFNYANYINKLTFCDANFFTFGVVRISTVNEGLAYNIREVLKIIVVWFYILNFRTKLSFRYNRLEVQKFWLCWFDVLRAINLFGWKIFHRESSMVHLIFNVNEIFIHFAVLVIAKTFRLGIRKII